jgi:hypothetical protein
MSRLKSAHDLSGLMKYASRAPWDEAMDDSLSAHLGPACEATGLDPDALFDLIGDHWEGPIWGCAFEDLLAQQLEPDGRNLVDDYLKRRGWNEKAPNKTYMRALRDAAMSLYEVSEVVPGQSMTLRDLLRERSPVTVQEHSATQTLVNWRAERWLYAKQRQDRTFANAQPRPGRLRGLRRTVSAARSHRKSPENAICSQPTGEVCASNPGSGASPIESRCWTASAMYVEFQ